MSRRGGFALPLALAIMMALSILSVTSLQVALAEFHANRGSRLAARALYTAEAGARHTLATWSSGPWPALVPGDSAGTGWISLSGVGRYRSSVLRVDDGSGTPLFRIITEGRPSRNAPARRRIVTLATAGSGGSLCCDAAAVVLGSLRVRGESSVDGRDHVPARWSGSCPTSGSGVPGLLVERDGDVRLQGDAEIRGNPTLVEDRTLDSSVLDRLGATTYQAMADRADLVLSGGTRFRDELGPRARKGVCETSDPENWGAPENPGSACWSYLPVVHVQGDLRIDDGGQGQGVLLVDGDLEVRGEMTFYGLIVVRGTLDWRKGSVLYGGVVVGNEGGGNRRSEVRDESRIEYSSCAVARTSTGPDGARPLPGRHWFEFP